MSIKISEHPIGKDSKPFLMAEAGLNHNGDLQRALEMIKVAKNSGGKIKLTSISVKVDDDLEKLTNIRQYHGYVVEELFVDKYIKFRNREKILVGDEIGTDQKEIQRIQINRAIRSHFEIQQELRDKKIKVLSLFFIHSFIEEILCNGLSVILCEIFDEITERVSILSKFFLLAILQSSGSETQINPYFSLILLLIFIKILELNLLKYLKPCSDCLCKKFLFKFLKYF